MIVIATGIIHLSPASIVNAVVMWKVVLEFNVTLIAKVISWRLVTHMCFLGFSHQVLTQLSFPSHRLLFSHASADMRGKDTAERKFASTGNRTYNHHESITLTTEPPGRGSYVESRMWLGKNIVRSTGKKEFRENMDRCTGRRNITEITMQTALNSIQSIKNSVSALWG